MLNPCNNSSYSVLYLLYLYIYTTDNDVYNTEVRENISSDNQEEVKHKNIDDFSTDNIITSPDIQED